MDFFARQEAARRATRWLLVAFLFCVALVVATVSVLVYSLAGMKDAQGQDASGPAVLAGVITLLVIGGASLFKTLSLRAGGGVVARSLGGTRIERGTRDVRRAGSWSLSCSASRWWSPPFPRWCTRWWG